MIALKGIPADRLARISNAFVEAARTPRFRELVEQQGATYALKIGSDMGAAMRAEHDVLGEVARKLGLAKALP